MNDDMEMPFKSGRALVDGMNLTDWTKTFRSIANGLPRFLQIARS